MASPAIGPQRNILNYILSQLHNLVRDLEAVLSSTIDRNTVDFAVYKLEQVILTCIQSNETWRNFIPEDCIWALISAYNILDEHDVVEIGFVADERPIEVL